jgi:hypothetical protein
MKSMKLFFAASFAVIILGGGEASAQSSRDNLHSVVQASFFPPLSTNGRHAGRYTNDFSLNLLAGVSENEQLLTLGGLANVIHHDGSGFQFAGLVNYMGHEARGFQFSGLANVVGHEGFGFQFSGLINVVGEEFKGFQFGGLLNKATDVYGFQFAGLANVAHNVSGAQFGVVNIAKHNDYPVGLVNIIKDGEMGLAVGYNDLGTASLTFRSGGGVLYGIIGLGYNHEVKRSEDAVTVIGGLGAHINVTPWFRINNELTTENIDLFSNDEEDETFRSGYTLLPAFRVGRHFEIFGGPGIYFMQTENREAYDLFPSHSLWKKEYASGKREQLSIGWQAGVQFLF